MRFSRSKNRKRAAIIRAAFGALAVALLALSLACRTPPRKSNRSSSGRALAAREGGGRDAGRANALDLFSASAEPFGTDPRASRPALVAVTAFAAAGGAVVLLTGAALVSAARSGRPRSPRRARSRRAA